MDKFQSLSMLELPGLRIAAKNQAIIENLGANAIVVYWLERQPSECAVVGSNLVRKATTDNKSCVLSTISLYHFRTDN